MPSRRQFLATALGGCASTCGCLSKVGVAHTGYLQFKILQVEWFVDGRPFRDEILWGSFDGTSRVYCRVAEEYDEIVNSLFDISLEEVTMNRLENTFTDVRFVVGFCWQGNEGQRCQNPQASRSTFNRVQFGDRAEIVFDHPSVHVVDVYEGEQGDPDNWSQEYETFDFSERHADRGIPIN